MTNQELIAKLNEIAKEYNDLDPEVGHVKAEEALLEYISDPSVTEAFDAIYKWYA